MKTLLLTLLLFSFAARAETVEEIRALWSPETSDVKIARTLMDIHLLPKGGAAALLPGLEHRNPEIRARVQSVLTNKLRSQDVPALWAQMDNDVVRPYLVGVLFRMLSPPRQAELVEKTRKGGKWADLETRRNMAREYGLSTGYLKDHPVARRVVLAGTQDEDAVIRTQSVLAANRTFRSDDPAELDRATLDLLLTADPRTALEIWDAFTGRPGLSREPAHRLETLLYLVQISPRLPKKISLKPFLDKALAKEFLAWDPVKRNALTETMSSLRKYGTADQKVWAETALTRHLGGEGGRQREFLALHGLSVREVLRDTSRITQTMDTTFAEIAARETSPEARHLATVKALVGQLNNPDGYIQKIVGERLEKLLSDPSAPHLNDPELSGHLEKLFRQPESAPIVGYLVARANPQNVLSYLRAERLATREAVARALIEELAHPTPGNEAVYLQAALKLLEQGSMRTVARVAEALLLHGERLGAAPEDRLAARESLAKVLASRSLNEAESLRAAELVGDGPLNVRLAVYLLTAKGDNRNQSPALQHRLDQALAWLPIQGSLERSPLNERRDNTPDHLWKIASADYPMEVRHLAFRAYVKLARDGQVPHFDVSALKTTGVEGPFLETVLAYEASLRQRLERGLQKGPSGGERVRNVCRLVAKAATWPFSTLKKAALAIPLAAWAGHQSFVRNWSRAREEAIPDVLFLSLDSIARNKKALEKTFLAAARELRKYLTDDDGKFDLEKHWQWLNHARSDLEGVKELALEHGLTEAMLDSPEAYVAHFGSVLANRDLTLDELSAKVLERKFRKALETGSGSELTLGDLIYEPEASIHTEASDAHLRGKW